MEAQMQGQEAAAGRDEDVSCRFEGAGSSHGHSRQVHLRQTLGPRVSKETRPCEPTLTSALQQCD